MAELIEMEGARRAATLRVAIEGCGHGTLDSIYASIQKSCEVKGWDGVDLVIIGGDFQAVRDIYDLNVTAMPAKYRQLGDFHKYYWGTANAPYLTIFVGGNHEASNHLFELYYGGWVAPNIYYLGAANVIRFGPIKIAAMSGIWKGYDFRKPHFERLPYNDADLHTIYHVRELDVRKLLAYRSQVDIGLSHDWPQGIEWFGNHEQLFRYKAHFIQDANTGKLGSVAAKNVLDHLRPPYWFSAHLHCRYLATKKFGRATHVPGNENHPLDTGDDTASIPRTSNGKSPAVKKEAQSASSSQMQDQPQLSAWHNFHSIAKEKEAKETADLLKEQQTRKEESERTGVPISAPYRFSETYKRVRLADGTGQPAMATRMDATGSENVQEEDIAPRAPQTDGCCESMPLKRRRTSSDEDAVYTIVAGDEDTATKATVGVAMNPDAIDLDSSSGDENDDDDDKDASTVPPSAEARARSNQGTLPLLHPRESFEVSVCNSSENEQATISTGAVVSHPVSSKFPSAPEARSLHSAAASVNSFHEPNVEAPPMPTVLMPPQSISVDQTASLQSEGEAEVPTKNDDSRSEADTDEVSEEMRAKLAALSSKFAESQAVEASPSLPHPEGITNEVVRFLALSKCAPKQHFLQLMEIEPQESAVGSITEPFRLQYDPEWLAILRVFAPELALGGRLTDPVPKHRGDTFYRERIIEEEKWVDENIIQPGKLDVPLNFTKNVHLYGPEESREMPRETTNPQTSTFCDLIGINNNFDISEEERDAREAVGPAPPPDDHHYRQRTDGGRGQGHRGGSRGSHRGGGRGGHGRGRGGRGRGSFRGGRGRAHH